jgi:hypothetical protein
MKRMRREREGVECKEGRRKGREGREYVEGGGGRCIRPGGLM